MLVERCSACHGPIVGGANRADPVAGHFEGVAVVGTSRHVDCAAAPVEEMIPFDAESRRYQAGEVITDRERSVVVTRVEFHGLGRVELMDYWAVYVVPAPDAAWAR
jgi:hypothetical protein